MKWSARIRLKLFRSGCAPETGIGGCAAREGAIPVILQKSLKRSSRSCISSKSLSNCADAVQEAVSMYGRIDGLINCAGGTDNVSLETGVEALD